MRRWQAMENLTADVPLGSILSYEQKVVVKPGDLRYVPIVNILPGWHCSDS
jgi:hypothetical protein